MTIEFCQLCSVLCSCLRSQWFWEAQLLEPLAGDQKLPPASVVQDSLDMQSTLCLQDQSQLGWKYTTVLEVATHWSCLNMLAISDVTPVCVMTSCEITVWLNAVAVGAAVVS